VCMCVYVCVCVCVCAMYKNGCTVCSSKCLATTDRDASYDIFMSYVVPFVDLYFT
jgi:hypothetical protein